MHDLAVGRQEALGPLYSRYAGLIYNVAAQSVDRGVAEELVQEVFLTIWRGAGSFDASQGSFRSWLLRLAHWRILNELRRQRRQPVEHRDEPRDVPDADPGPEQRAWQNENGQIIAAALGALPLKQRQAIALAFLDDMTHEQVAQTLDVPLGTAKTRIRSGLQVLRLRLAPIAASLLGLGLVAVGARYLYLRAAFERDERALILVTTSELVPLRLTPASADVPAGAHANYRGRAGNSLAVLTTEGLPALSSDHTYQAWVRHADTWTSLGAFSVGPDGGAHLIADNPSLSELPAAVEITVEPAPGGSLAPSGVVVLSWPGTVQ
jgi:RNA polymerase sigma factor (sigma-70 family)